MHRYLLIVLIVLGGFFTAKAQIADTTIRRTKKDSLNMKKDSAVSKPYKPKPFKEVVYHPDSTHSPKKAVLRSAAFPGLGQIYNKKGLWYRLPALYTGLGLLLRAAIRNGEDYSLWLRASAYREHGRPLTEIDPLPQYSSAPDQFIFDNKDIFRRNRDLSILSFIGVWGVNMADAYVTAKFIHSYSMDNNLGFKITPTLMADPVYASNFNITFTPGLKLTFLLK